MKRQEDDFLKMLEEDARSYRPDDLVFEDMGMADEIDKDFSFELGDDFEVEDLFQPEDLKTETAAVREVADKTVAPTQNAEKRQTSDADEQKQLQEPILTEQPLTKMVDALVDSLPDGNEDTSKEAVVSMNQSDPDMEALLNGLDMEETQDGLPEDLLSLHSIIDEDEQGELPDLNLDVLMDEEANEIEEKAERPEKKKKKSLLVRLFGNVPEPENAKKKVNPNVELDENGNPIKKPKKTAEQLKAEKEAKKKTQDEAKKEKEAKLAVKKAQNEAKLKKKEEVKKKKALMAVEQEPDNGRINRVGAGIVFVFFAIVGIFIVQGTNMFSYSQNVKQASEFFGLQKYTNAYNEVRGLKIKEKDYEIYDKIMTVMYVNKQLNSYQNYYNMQFHPQALDSLLKGLQRYDDYVSLAKELGVKSDLDYLRKKMLKELQSVYHMTEAESYRIIDSGSQEAYSAEVFKAASVN